MIGYHYTTMENYEKIREQGLLPYHIDKDEIHHIIPCDALGIWIWTAKLKPEAHVGSVLFQVASKQSLRICLLEVTYNEEDAIHVGGRLLWLAHIGTIGNWIYHPPEGEYQTAVILEEPVHQSNIKLLNTYDLLNLIGR